MEKPRLEHSSHPEGWLESLWDHAFSSGSALLTTSNFPSTPRLTLGTSWPRTKEALEGLASPSLVLVFHLCTMGRCICGAGCVCYGVAVVKADINTIVLVGVLKDARDLALLRRERRYRIPVKDAPRRLFQYLAFYQPVAHGRSGKCIRYYARVLKRRRVKRLLLLSEEPDHPQADDFYYDYYLGKIQRLRRPLRNVIPRRVTFGYTTLHRLKRAGDMLELYGVLKGEQIISDALKAAGIPVVAQQYINDNGKRYFLDFAVFCRQGKLAIECDNARAHSGRSQRSYDRMKDAALRRLGWKVIRLTEAQIVSNLPACLTDIRRTIRTLGGAEK